MTTQQIENIEKILAWVKSCPYPYTISSMTGRYIHIKYLVPTDSDIAIPTGLDKSYGGTIE